MEQTFEKTPETNGKPRTKRISWLVLSARTVSLVCAPFYLPVTSFIILFTFSYLNMLPPITKLILTGIVYLFTILLPHFCIMLYRQINGWTSHQMSRRERRFVPYIVSIASYAALLYLLIRLHIPQFALGIIVGALAIQIVCSIVNSRIKVSTHAAASGGLIGALIAFSFIFSFDPTFWLCLCILLCGMVCSARLILRQHTFGELGWGVFIGIVCGFCGILFV